MALGKKFPSRGERTVRAALDVLAAHLVTTQSPPVVLVVIDTVCASLSGSEDSSEAVSAYLRAVRRIVAHVPEAAAILAHHAGWQDGESRRKRERGSSAFRGNVDVTLYLEGGHYDTARGEAQLVLRALKVRDTERPPPIRLVRRRVELAESIGRGEPVTSCIIERDRRTGHVEIERSSPRYVPCARPADRQRLAGTRSHSSSFSLDR